MHRLLPFCRPQKARFTHYEHRRFSHDYPSAIQIERWKHPSRGGQNLSDRYQRLERSLRGKESFTKQIHGLPGSSTVLSPEKTQPSSSTPSNIFRGYMIPKKPRPPETDECCMSGCAVCVYDLYEEALSDYNKSIASLRASLSDLRVPEWEWPPSIRTCSTSGTVERKKDVSLSAFEEMERALQAKRESAQASLGS